MRKVIVLPLRMVGCRVCITWGQSVACNIELLLIMCDLNGTSNTFVANDPQWSPPDNLLCVLHCRMLKLPVSGMLTDYTHCITIELPKPKLTLHLLEYKTASWSAKCSCLDERFSCVDLLQWCGRRLQSSLVISCSENHLLHAGCDFDSLRSCLLSRPKRDMTLQGCNLEISTDSAWYHSSMALPSAPHPYLFQK